MQDAQRLRHVLLDGVLRGPPVERHPAAEEGVRGQHAQEQVCVCGRRPLAAATVARRAGRRPRALGADP